LVRQHGLNLAAPVARHLSPKWLLTR
jgi:hypothetical protein